MRYDKICLKELITIKNGKDHKSLKDGKYPVYGSGGIMRYVEKYLYNKESVLLPRKGTLNNIQFVDKPFWTVDTCYYTEVNTEKVIPYFLFRNLRQFDIEVLNTGSAVPSMTFDKYYSIQVALPDLEKQQKIVDILKPYDNLIENNQKQIKLLEEAAQRLYKEWFVDLHFPGYEAVAIVDGVPEGWKIHPIDDVFQIKYGKTLPTSKISSEGKYPVYGANGIIGFYSEKNIDDYVVLITSRGNGSGDVLITHDKESFVTNNSFIVKPINHNVRLPFIHQLMKCTGFKNICTGSAQPQLTNKSISTLCVLMPSYDLISRFCETERVWYEKLEKLLTQNKLLNQARDRLLPKLMSGEIEV